MAAFSASAMSGAAAIRLGWPFAMKAFGWAHVESIIHGFDEGIAAPPPSLSTRTYQGPLVHFWFLLSFSSHSETVTPWLKARAALVASIAVAWKLRSPSRNSHW